MWRVLGVVGAVFLALVVVVVVGARVLVDADRICDRARAQMNDYSGRTDQLARSIGELKLAVAVHPGHATSWALLGRAARNAAYRQYDEYAPEGMRMAHEFARKAIALDPRCAEAYKTEAYTFLEEKDYVLARSHAERARDLGLPDIQTHFLMGSIDVADRRPESARQHAVAALAMASTPGEQVIAHDILVDVATSLGDLPAADSSYRVMIALDPDNAWDRVNYAGFLARHERYREAIVWADSALAVMEFGMAHRVKAQAHYGLGMEYLYQAGGWSEAHREFLICTQEDPDYALGWYGVAFVQRGRYEKSGKPEYQIASDEALARAAQLDPDHPAIRKLMAVNAGNGERISY